MKPFFIFSFLFYLLFNPSLCFAQKITFASPEDLPPKIFMVNGKLRGTYIDIITAACKRMKVEPVFVQYPWPRAMAMVKTGKVDAIFPPLKTLEREEFLYFPSTPLSYTRNAIFARKARKLKVKKMEDLQNYIVGINDAYSYGEVFDKYKDNLKLEISRNEEMQINKLAHLGQVRMDVVAASEEAFKFIAKEMGLSREFEMIHVFSETPSYVAFSKSAGVQNKKIALEFNRVLKQLKEEGVIQEINEKYYK